MYFKEKLNYLYETLEPYIDTHALAIHYNKHYLNYLKRLNEILISNNYDYKYSLEQLLFHINDYKKEQDDLLFNLGGVLNHQLFFKCLGGEMVLPFGKLEDKINSKYESFDNFYDLFKAKALELKGSGYTFLVYKDGDIDIINMSNQTTPLLFNYVPLFTIDLWEHAYYLDYYNERNRYIDSLKNIVDFTYASMMYEKIELL